MLLERELPAEVSDIAECLARFPRPIERLGFEAGTMGQHLFHGPKTEDSDVVCMDARQVDAALSTMHNETDKDDARGIASALRTGWFSPVHMKSREAYGGRASLAFKVAVDDPTRFNRSRTVGAHLGKNRDDISQATDAH